MSEASGSQRSDRPYLVVSADSHAGPRLEQDLRSYCPPSERDAFDAFAAEYRASVASGEKAWQSGWYSAPRSDDDDRDHMPEEWRRAGLDSMARIKNNAGSYDPDVRLADMDQQGIAAEAIFAGAQNQQVLPWAGMNAAGSLDIPGRLRALGARIWNEWLADFCSVAPERLLGIAQIPIWDVGAAVREVYWAKEHGLRAINFPAPRPDYPPYNAREVYEPFWSAVEEVDLPLVTHNASGEAGDGANGQAAAMLWLVEILWFSRRALGQLTLGGVFDRHPTLTVAFVEQRGHWVQECLAELDSAYVGVPHNTSMRLLGARPDAPERFPSEYWRNNCVLANAFMAPHEAALRDQIGLHTVVWGSDYPHLEGTWPRTRLALRHAFSDVPEPDVRTILGANAARLFRLDVEALQPVADRIGPTPDELARPLAADEYPSYTGLAFRKAGIFH